MQRAHIPGADERAVMRGCARITPKYAVEITLYDFSGVYPIEVIWDPNLPSATKQKKLADKVNAALQPYALKALELGGSFHGGAA